MTTPAKVLIVEDEQVVAMDLEIQLMTLGYDVVGRASTGKEALRLAGETSPDLVLMDIQLQGSLDGITTAEEIRRRWQIPLVFVTAYASEETLNRAKAAEPYGYVTKPFHIQELHATTTMALRRHRLTQNIFQEHSWLGTLLASITDGVIATDREGSVKFMNLAAEALTGWTLQRAMGQRIEDVYSLQNEDGVPLMRCQLRRALETNKAVERQRFRLVVADRVIPVEDSAAPIHDAEGQLAGAVTVIIDVTEREYAERERERLVSELARSNADLSRFSYTVSHDLQAPVRTVKSFAELLSRQLQGRLSNENSECLAFITTAAAGMQLLIQALLQYAQVGQAPLRPEDVPVGEVMTAVQRSLAGTIADTGARISTGPLPAVWADRVQLQQVFQNLLENAMSYRLPDQLPSISVTAESSTAGWTFAVADQGRGIPAEELERVFAPLTRLHGPEISGTGIGLALCRTIIDRHGGRIWVESAGAGQGVTFCFILPHAPAAAA